MTATPMLPVELYPALAQVQPSLASLGPTVAPMQVPAGTLLFDENAPCRGFPLVLEGEIKVSRSSGDGRTLELYRVVPGELCLVSSACLFRTQPLSAQGSTTKASTLLGRGSHLSLTHQALADELGTVREIVTRLLRRFEREGWVALGREQIQVLNGAALRELAST